MSKTPEEESQPLDVNSPAFIAMQKLMKENPNSPLMQETKEFLREIAPKLDNIVTGLEDIILGMDPDPRTQVGIMRSRLKRAMGKILSDDRRQFIEMGYRLGHAFEPVATIIRQTKDEKEALSKGKGIGIDWYTFRVRGISEGITPDNLRDRFSRLETPEIAYWEEFSRGLQLRRPSPNAEQKAYFYKMENGTQRGVLLGKDRTDFIAHIVFAQEDIRPMFFLMAIADLESMQNLHLLEDFLKSDKGQSGIRSTGKRVEFPSFLSTYSDWFTNQRSHPHTGS